MFNLSSLASASSPDVAKLLSSVSLNDQERTLSDLLAAGAPDSSHFASSVKTAFSANPRVRELSAAYLVMHAAENAELSLMLVNSIQRMLSDANALVRVHALRLAAAIKAPAAAPILAHLLATACADPSPLVRIACFQSVGCCRALDPSLSTGLLSMVVSALQQPRTAGAPEVGGWGVTALALGWPQRLDATHAVFERFVRWLPQFEPFCQVHALRLFLDYCVRTSPDAAAPRCRQLVAAARPLLENLDTAVVIEAANVLATLGSQRELALVPSALLALPLTPLVASSVLQIGLRVPFDAHREQLLLRDYPRGARAPMLRLAATCSGRELSARELDHLCFALVAWHDDAVACRAALSCIAQLSGAQSAVRALMKLARLAARPALGAGWRSLLFQTVRVVVQQHELAADARVFRLLARIATDDDVEPPARAAILALVSQNCARAPLVALEILRVLARTFALQSAEVRLQTLLLAAKVATVAQQEHAELAQAMLQYVLTLTRYDESVEIRDRARTFALLETDAPLLRLMLVCDKPAPVPEVPQAFAVDTASAALGHRTSMYRDPPMFGANVDADLSTFEQAVRPTEAAPGGLQEAVVSEIAPSVDKVQRINKMTLDEFLGPRESSSDSDIDSETDSGSGSDTAAME